MSFRDEERTKPWHRAPAQPPSVPAWACEIACLMAVAVEEWENASWSLRHFISSQELSEANIYGKKQLKAEKIKVLFLLPPACCALAVWSQTPTLM